MRHPTATSVSSFGLRGRLARAIAYGTVVAAFGAAYGMIVYALMSHWGMQTLGGSMRVFAVAFVLSLAVGMPLHVRVQALVDGWFKTRLYTVDTLHALFASLATGVAVGELTRRALEIVRVEIGLDRATLYLLSSTRREFVPVATSGEEDLPSVTLFESHPLSGILAMLHVEISRTTLLRQSRYASVRSQCVAALDEMRADALFPLEVEGRLAGFLVLAGARSLDGLTPGEVELLRALSAEFSVRAARVQDEDRIRNVRLELERFARYLPKAVAQDVLEGRVPGERGRRRNVTTVECEIGGFEVLADVGDPQELGETLRRFHALAAEETRREGGTFAFAHSERVTLVFGDPETQSDHALRALRTASRLVPEVRALWAPWRQHAPDLDVRIGVATGVAFVGFLAVGSELTYQVVGAPAQEARALSEDASGGDVLLTESTRAASGALVRVEPVVLSSATAHRSTAHRLIAIGHAS